MRNDRLIFRKLFLFFGDACMLLLSLYLALILRQLSFLDWKNVVPVFDVFVPIFLLLLATFFLFDLYNLRSIRNFYRTIYLIYLALIFSSLFITILLYVSPKEVTPKTVLFLFDIFALFLLSAWRFLYKKYSSNLRYIRKVAVIGTDLINENFEKILRSIDGVDYKIIGYFGEARTRSFPAFTNLAHLGDFSAIKSTIKRKNIDELVIAFDFIQHPKIVKDLSDSLAYGVRIYNWEAFYEYIFQKVPTNSIDHFWFINNIDESDKKFYELFKRTADLLFSLTGTIILVFLLPLITLGIKLSSKGPIFYSQIRVGRDGLNFKLRKFRTMREDAEKNGAKWADRHDDRIFPFGRFLRKTRLDEIPQFLNILKGDMSIVGPRPERPEFIPVLQEKIPFYYKRNMVLPGLTGYAQIMFPYAASIEDSIEKVGYDLYYIKHRSLFMYFKIILKTIKTILAFGGR